MLSLFALPGRLRDPILVAAALFALGALAAHAQQSAPALSVADQLVRCGQLPLCSQLVQESLTHEKAASDMEAHLKWVLDHWVPKK
jgi:hypothetical protein